MRTIDKADVVFHKSVTEALGYVELAQEIKKTGGDTSSMTLAAIKALQRFSDNDELVDAMYDATLKVLTHAT